MTIGEQDRSRTVRGLLPRGLALLGVLAFVGLIAFGLSTKATNRSIDESLAKGAAPLAPSFDDPVLAKGSLPSGLGGKVGGALADGQLSLRELKGTPFVLNFWASWCIPCREEAPILEAGWRRFGTKGVLFLGLNMQDLTGDAHRFIDEFHLTYPHVREPSNATAQAYGVTGIPETYFVTDRGRIVGHVIGAVSSDQLVAGARAAKQGGVVGSENGGARRAVR